MRDILHLLDPLRALLVKDLRRRARAPLAFLVILAFPLVFASIMAISFGGDGDEIRKALLLIEDRDGGLVGNVVLEAFTSAELSELFEVLEVEKGDGQELMEAGEASALLIIPDGASGRFLRREAFEIELVKNPSEAMLPEIAEQVALLFVTYLDASAGAGGPVRPEGSQIVVETVQLEEDSESRPQGSIFLFVLPGVAVFSLFMVGDLVMQDLLAESEAGTLKRQLGAPISGRMLVVAKALTTAVLALGSLLVLALVAALVSPVRGDAWAFLLLSMAIVLALTGALAAIYGCARTRAQGSTISSIMSLILAFLGGAFVPLSSMPAIARKLAPISPFYWATEGMREILTEGAKVGDLWSNILVLGILGAVLLFVGGKLLEIRVSRSAA